VDLERTLPARAPAIVVLVAAIIVAGCAGGPGGRGSRLFQYTMPKGQILKYKASQHNTQSMEMMGREVTNTAEGSYEVSLVSKGPIGDNLGLRVTVDSMTSKVTTPQGEITPDLGGVVGKSFDMALSKLGKELDASGADSLIVGMGGGSRSMGPEFRTFFPDLPGMPLKVGDTWTTSDTVSTEESGLQMQIITGRANTFLGFETVDGLECAKIAAAVTGTFSGKGQQMGADIALDGKLEGADTWYFAPKRGLFVKSSSDIRTDGSVVVGGAQAMTIPMKQEMKSEVVLLGS
jgi:hypothetical protein